MASSMHLCSRFAPRVNYSVRHCLGRGEGFFPPPCVFALKNKIMLNMSKEDSFSEHVSQQMFSFIKEAGDGFSFSPFYGGGFHWFFCVYVSLEKAPLQYNAL